MKRKSMIDWNEIVPRLPKKARDTLYLEAVVFLSENDDMANMPESLPQGTPASDTLVKVRRKKRKTKANGSTPYHRTTERNWRDSGDGKTLAMPGRKYKINKDATPGFRDGSAISKVWEHLINSSNEVITYEGIASILKGQNLEPVNINYLWRRRLIEVAHA